MRVLHHFGQVLDAVSCCLPRTESRRTDIDSVCTRLNRRLGYALVACRSEQAKR